MKFLLFLFLLLPTFAQTQLAPSQVPWGQTDETFFRQCIFMQDGSYAQAYAYFPTQRHATASDSHAPSTLIQISQIKGYGLSVSGDGTKLIIQNSYGQVWTIATTNTTATGTVELRYAMITPNLNLIGLAYTDLGMVPGGWGMTSSGNYTEPPVASATLQNGIFTMVPSTTVFHNACELWGTGNFTTIHPNP